MPDDTQLKGRDGVNSEFSVSAHKASALKPAAMLLSGPSVSGSAEEGSVQMLSWTEMQAVLWQDGVKKLLGM